MKKTGVVCLLLMFRWRVMVLKISKIVRFLLFLADVSKKSKKRTIFDILRTITLERNIKSKQTTTVFSSTFYALSVSNNSFCFWKTSKFSFMWSPLWSQKHIFWSVNYTLNDQIRTINIKFWNLLNISFPSMYNMFIHQIVHAFRLISWTISNSRF